MRRLISSAIALLSAAVLPVLAQGQAPPVDLSGTWTFDLYVSDNPQQVAAAIRTDLGSGANELSLFDGSGEGGRGGRGMGRRNRSPEEADRRPTPPSADEQRTIDTITQMVRYAPPTLRVEQSPTSVTIGDPQGTSRTFQTNGKREPQQFDTAHADSVAQWEGPQLVIRFDLGKGRQMTYTYSIVPTTRQLLVRVAFERAPKEPGPFEIKFVYDRSM